MAETKLVFRNAEERELWRAVFYKLCGSRWFPSDVGVTDATTAEAQADVAVLAYRERCGDDVAKAEASIEAAYDKLSALGKENWDRANRGEPLIQPTRDEGPWAIWSDKKNVWHGQLDKVDVLYFAFPNKSDAEARAQAADGVVCPAPRTRAEFERGPGAVDEKIGGGE